MCASRKKPWRRCGGCGCAPEPSQWGDRSGVAGLAARGDWHRPRRVLAARPPLTALLLPGGPTPCPSLVNKVQGAPRGTQASTSHWIPVPWALVTGDPTEASEMGLTLLGKTRASRWVWDVRGLRSGAAAVSARGRGLGV